MRSSKSRSRNKNRNRPSGGNVINRVFDSSGPEGKVRGTPQQIIDKYNQLARDAQLSGDRVALENFQQHAEHYTRLLAQAQKEMEAKREQQQGGQNQQHQNNQQGGGQPGNQQGAQQGSQPANGPDAGDAPREGGGGGGRRNRRGREADVFDAPDEGGGLVETPEARSADAAGDQPDQPDGNDAKPKRRPRRRAPKPDEGSAAPEPTEDA